MYVNPNSLFLFANVLLMQVALLAPLQMSPMRLLNFNRYNVTPYCPAGGRLALCQSQRSGWPPTHALTDCHVNGVTLLIHVDAASPVGWGVKHQTKEVLRFKI